MSRPGTQAARLATVLTLYALSACCLQGLVDDPIVIPSNGPLTALIATLPLQVSQSVSSRRSPAPPSLARSQSLRLLPRPSLSCWWLAAAGLRAGPDPRHQPRQAPQPGQGRHRRLTPTTRRTRGQDRPAWRPMGGRTTSDDHDNWNGRQGERYGGAQLG